MRERERERESERERGRERERDRQIKTYVCMMHVHMFQAMATPNVHTGVVTIKRIWDETALRVQVSKSTLQTLIGDEVADRAQAVVDNRRARKRLVYPGYTVQSMQLMGLLRFGHRLDECAEVIVPAISIMDGVFQSIPSWHLSKLQELVSKVRCLVLRFFPDGHPSNRLVPYLEFRQASCAA